MSLFAALSPVFVQDHFVSDEECGALARWTSENLMHFGTGCGRASTRFCEQTPPFPVEAYDIQQRVVELFALQDVPKAPFIDGIYVSYARNGSEYAYKKHRDPVYVEGTYTLHCNVVTTDSDGGEVVLDENQTVAMTKGRLVAYPVSELDHEVLAANTEVPRNLWVFGFCIPKNWPAK